MNTLEAVLARRAKRDAWNHHAATLRAEYTPPPVVPTRNPGRPRTHGHEVAYWRHRRAGETPCGPCAAAHETAKARQRERRSKAKT